MEVVVDVSARLSFYLTNAMPKIDSFSSLVGCKIELAAAVAPANHWVTLGLGTV